MLIPSWRHTVADLDLWAEYETADSLTSVAAPLRKARVHVQRFAREPCYCSVSWGKDSVLTAAIVMDVAPKTPLVWVRPAGAEVPGCDEVRDEFLRQYPKAIYHETHCPENIWNDPTVSNETAFASAVEAAGTRRRITGVRAAESSVRKQSMRSHGISTLVSCRPLGWLSTREVFAALTQYSLPIHPNYAMLGGGRWQREHLRTTSLGSTFGDGHGKGSWEREYYGDILRRMEAAKAPSPRENANHSPNQHTDDT